ncbi:MAG: metal ABC transporter permease [Alphaproteobacteria bacterium]|nr:metal ABC transporter permease [Alphaproteobacteria bacterium]
MSCAPMGVLIVLRRMSLMGDALSHSILPGVAIGFLLRGLSLPMMSLGGFISALLVAFLAGVVSRTTLLREDASLVGFYLISLAFGSLIVSIKGTNVDLMHILFGTILAVDKVSLLLVAGISSLTLIIGALIYRPLIIECFDPSFMYSLGARGALYHGLFIMLIVLCMVASFQALGTLMALGLMMLPAIAARFWAEEIGALFIIAFIIASLSGYAGLLLSYHYIWPSGPSIILVAGLFYTISLLIGRYGSIWKTHK